MRNVGVKIPGVPGSIEAGVNHTDEVHDPVGSEVNPIGNDDEVVNEALGDGHSDDDGEGEYLLDVEEYIGGGNDDEHKNVEDKICDGNNCDAGNGVEGDGDIEPDMNVADRLHVEEGDSYGASDGLKGKEGMGDHQEVGSVLIIVDVDNKVAGDGPHVDANGDGADGVGNMGGNGIDGEKG